MSDFDTPSLAAISRMLMPSMASATAFSVRLRSTSFLARIFAEIARSWAMVLEVDRFPAAVVERRAAVELEVGEEVARLARRASRVSELAEADALGSEEA